jgi:hypothetical protein
MQYAATGGEGRQGAQRGVPEGAAALLPNPTRASCCGSIGSGDAGVPGSAGVRSSGGGGVVGGGSLSASLGLLSSGSLPSMLRGDSVLLLDGAPGRTSPSLSGPRGPSPGTGAVGRTAAVGGAPALGVHGGHVMMGSAASADLTDAICRLVGGDSMREGMMMDAVLEDVLASP